MSSPLTISAVADAVNPAIQKMWLKVASKMPTYYDKMYHVTTGVTDLFSRESNLSGYKSASRVVENAVILAQSPIQGFDQTFEQVKYGTIAGFTDKVWKFAIKKRDLEGIVKELKEACIMRREELLARKYDAAFLSAYTESDDAGNYSVTTTGGDAVAMASASHTREDGGTAWSNIVSDGTTSNMNLDYPALKALKRIGSLVKTPRGKPWTMDYNRIVVKEGTAAHMRALEILGALKNNKIPGEFSNDGAAVSTFELVANPWLLGTGDATSTTNLSSATNFHAIDTRYLSEKCGPQYMENTPISLSAEPHVIFKTDEIQWKSTMWFAYGHADARCTAHSSGANA